MANEILLRINIDDIVKNAEAIEQREIQRRFNIMFLLSKISKNGDLRSLFSTEARGSMEIFRYPHSNGQMQKITIGIPLMADENSTLALTPYGIEYFSYDTSDHERASTRMLVIDPNRISKGDKIGSALEPYDDDLLFEEGMLLSGSEQEVVDSIQAHMDMFAAKLKSRQAAEK